MTMFNNGHFVQLIWKNSFLEFRSFPAAEAAEIAEASPRLMRSLSEPSLAECRRGSAGYGKTPEAEDAPSTSDDGAGQERTPLSVRSRPFISQHTAMPPAPASKVAEEEDKQRASGGAHARRKRRHREPRRGITTTEWQGAVDEGKGAPATSEKRALELEVLIGPHQGQEETAFHDDEDIAAAADGDGGQGHRGGGQGTTVMLCRLPGSITRSALLELMDSQGFRSHYDFVYLPLKMKTMTNVGYAFINMISDEHAVRFAEVFDGFSGWSAWTRDEWSGNSVVATGCLQGLRANIDRYRNSPLMKANVPDDAKPVVFVRGERVAFPGPTRSVRMLRSR